MPPDWLKEARLARVGAFRYEPVDGAVANVLPGAVPDEVKEERWHRLMGVQKEISTALLAERVGRTIPVIIDEVDEEGPLAGHSGMPRISTAAYSSMGQSICSPARSFRPGSSMPTNTIYGQSLPVVEHKKRRPRMAAFGVPCLRVS